MNRAETKDRIREALAIRGMKQSELVEKTGIDKGQMSSYLSGRYKPKQTNLNLMARALSVDEAWLMGYDVPMQRVNKTTDEKAPLIISFYNSLNSHGKEIATEQVRLLTLDEKYTKPTNAVPPETLTSPYSHEQAASRQTPILLARDPAPDYLAVNAAHERTDIEVTEEMIQHDNDIMDDENF